MTKSELEQKLRPCPFCNTTKALKVSGPVNDPGDDVWLNSWQIVCHSCNCGGPALGEYEDAVRHWNTRALQKDAKWAIERIRAQMKGCVTIMEDEVMEILRELEQSE